MLSQTQTNTSNNTGTAGAVNAKLLSGFGILFATLFLIFVPLLLCRYFASAFTDYLHRNRRLFGHAYSTFNCFASGIFLGTAYLHIYVDAEENIRHGLEEKNITTEFPLNNIVLLLGMLFILSVEEAASFIQERNHNLRVESETTRLIKSNGSASGENSGQNAYETMGAHADHNHNPLEVQSILQSILLCLAMSIHSVFEGLSIGLASTPAEVYSLVFAVSFHKIVVTVTMGINFGYSTSKRVIIIILSLIYSAANPLGVLIGGFVSDVVGDSLPGGILQSISCGTFIYIATFEMLPHELQKPNRIRTLYIFSALMGLLVIVLLTLFGPHHHHEGKHHHHAP